MPASNARYDLLKSRLRRFTRTLQGVEDGDLKAVHSARIASRRVRELLPVLQLDRAVTQKLIRRLRKVRRRLGRVREFDVLLELVGELQESGRYSAAAMRQLTEHLQGERQRAWKKAAGKPPAVELRHIARALNRVTRRLEDSESDGERGRGLRWAIDARIARHASTLKTAIDEAGAMYLPERLHAVRIALKKLRYSIELSAEASGASSDSDVPTLKRAQNLLGRMHDLEVLIDRVRQFQASLAPPDLAVWRDLDRLLASAENSCRRLHARYVREREAVLAVCQRRAVRTSAVSRHAAARRAG